MSATRFTTPFNARSTAADVVAGVDLTGQRAIVTGASSGIGVETARALATAGAEVTLAVRDVQAGERTAEDIRSTTANGSVRVAPLDLSDQDSIAAFVAAWEGPLHILVNNAGVSATPERRTPEGWELQFATNHLGHFALATGLHRALAAAGQARVVSLSSIAHVQAPMVFEDVNFRERPYDRMLAYGESKTATALFAVEANRRWAGDGITVNAANPGAVATNLGRHLTPEDYANLPAFDFKTPEQGAATSVLLAAWPQLSGTGGRYFEDCNQAVRHSAETPLQGVADHAIDPAAAERLWQISLDMLAEARRA
ncbi:NAD(P)-dependent dehydrogenase (short-subunit alcohol dehydrogenase family) [Micromonospora luteifusca]|uniref:NAD(P)-dependent dehydrogenase (Short-subunit alcohol dehydrogenase family) n=1 Tax=Micromonospora luteifusca TaxID=709860 RepID=A0ABS2LL36_9ACTN|nr:SDR family NAD(P)-dependent oxidoreductase [Micromonospora luteifusca]MBM7488906.1 NAD(P)-dependent dehydrogenase (short-subunit alcohol dehydrogenase family) [Micromonospora luteifusca]